MSLPYHRGQMASNSGYKFGNRDQRATEASKNLMEQENDRHWGELGEQVELLKSLSSDINAEVSNQNKFLDGMGDNFGSASTFFASTMNKLSVMTSTSSSKHMYYLAVFVVFVFLVIYFMMNKK